jgi:hypothetical protein
MGGPKAPSAVHSPLGSIFYPILKANIIAGYVKISSELMTYATVTIDDMWRINSKPCRLTSIKTSL